MGAVAYTSSMARGELYGAERAREYRHIEKTPEIERAEIRRIFGGKGFSGALLEGVVDAVCANKDVWVAVMMDEEHRLAPVDRRESLRSAAIVGFSSLVGAILPVLPFGIFARGPAIAFSLLLGAVGLFGLGAFKASVTTKSRMQGGAVLASIGLASAMLGYVIGALLGRAG
jgi:predicted membrane protein (TIGR00267 family)